MVVWPRWPGARPWLATLLALVENLHGLVGNPHVDELANEPERHGVPVAVGFDMIVGTNPASLPSGKTIGFIRQGFERRLVDGGEKIAARGFKTAHDAAIEIMHKTADRGIELGQREEALVAQPRQDPALGDLDGDFDLRLVFRTPWPCRQDRRAVMLRHVPIRFG